LKFNQLHDEDMGRIRYQRVCEVDGEVVPFEHIVKGYEVDKGQYVVLTDQDFDAVPVESNRLIDIVQFVDAEDIDPIYYKKTYYHTDNFKTQEVTYAYMVALHAIVEAKEEGKEFEAAPEPEPTKVVDLMEALKASVEATKKKAGGKAEKPARAKKAAAG